MESSRPFRGLGTLLRHLVDLVDGDVQLVYADLSIHYRPRYTPIVRALLHAEPLSIREIASHAGMTHSAVSQTVAQMKKDGLVRIEPSARDARERSVRLAPKCRNLAPDLQRQGSATDAAADALDAELTASLRKVVSEAIAKLGRGRDLFGRR